MTAPTVLAAGGVLWRGDPERPEIAVVHRPRYDDWSLPKGKAEPEEPLILTALREIEEETGSRGILGPPLLTTRYLVLLRGLPVRKTVAFWSVRHGSGSFSPSKEVDALDWLSLESARRRVTSGSDRTVLAEFDTIPRTTNALVVLRHGSTTQPKTRKGAASGRVLSRKGRAQAEAMVPVLHGLGVTALVSSNSTACVDMLRPYADQAGLPLRVDSRLGLPGDRTGVRQVGRELLDIASVEPVAACCSGEDLEGLSDFYAARLRPRHQSARVRKGGWLLLHVADRVVQRAESHEPVIERTSKSTRR